MRWSDITEWDPAPLESLTEDLRRASHRALECLDSVEVAEGGVISTGEAVQAMLTASKRSRGSIEWFASQLARLAAITDHAGDVVREVSRMVGECIDLALASPYMSITKDGGVDVHHFSRSTPDGTISADEANALIDSDAQALRQHMSDALAHALSVESEYAAALRALASQEAPKVYGTGAIVRADGQILGVDAAALGELANAAYFDEIDDLAAILAEWHKADHDELRSLGLDPSLFVDDTSGFHASLFVNSDGHYVLAFRGSDFELNDWQNNLLSMIGVPEQQKLAVELSTRLRTALEVKGIDHS